MKPLAYIDGWLAHANDQPLENPYNEFTQEANCSAWDSGYCQRYNLMKHEQITKVDLLDEKYNTFLGTL